MPSWDVTKPKGENERGREEEKEGGERKSEKEGGERERGIEGEGETQRERVKGNVIEGERGRVKGRERERESEIHLEVIFLTSFK